MTRTRYQQLADELRRRIVTREIPVGAALPSEAALCEEFGVARGTARQAVGELRAEGLIGGGRGAPPVVRTDVLAQPLETLLSFTSWAERTGRNPGQRTIEIARRGASRPAADALGLDEGEPVIDVLRVRLLDGRPVMIERTSFIEPVGRLLFDFDPDSGSIFAHLTDSGVDLTMARHTFDAVAASAQDAELLCIPTGSPLLRERRRTTSRSGEPMEFSDDRYCPDVVTFTVENSSAGTLAPVQRWQRDPVAVQSLCGSDAASDRRRSA